MDQQNKQTYVSITHSGYGDDFTYDVIYAGNDLEAAKFNFMGKPMDRGIIQVWLEGFQIKQLERKRNSSKWDVTFDRVAELQQDLEKLNKEIKEKEEQLQKIFNFK